jgi:NAD(P)-dependent dehydrogenase (short-subunit alcohol dehydrogenase family)
MPEQERRQFLSSLAQQLPVGKVGEASDLAEGILFLMKNAYTTGTVLHVEGGKETFQIPRLGPYCSTRRVVGGGAGSPQIVQ